MFSTSLSPCGDIGHVRNVCGIKTVQENSRRGEGCVLQPARLPVKFLNARVEGEGRGTPGWFQGNVPKGNQENCQLKSL